MELRLFSPGGEKIYYTLDGSEPTGDSLLYEGAIRIADNTQEENRYAGRTDLTPTKAHPKGITSQSIPEAAVRQDAIRGN